MDWCDKKIVSGKVPKIVWGGTGVEKENFGEGVKNSLGGLARKENFGEGAKNTFFLGGRGDWCDKKDVSGNVPKTLLGGGGTGATKENFG